MKVLPLVPVLVLSLCAPSLAHAQSPRLVGSAQFLVSATPSALPSPCDDSLFATLQGRPLDSLSTREYEYFMLKTKECGEYRKAAMAGVGKSASTRRKRQVGISTFDDSAPEPDGDAVGLFAITIGILGLLTFISISVASQHIVIF
jgi:hypothetical protein